MIVVLAELEEGYDSMPELEFDSESEFTVGVGVGVEITDNFEGAHWRRSFWCRWHPFVEKAQRHYPNSSAAHFNTPK
jgi:hypothetical protein